MNAKEIKMLPKVELHCHLDGSLSKDFMEKQMERTIIESEISVTDACTSLAEYLKTFDLPIACLQTESAMELAGYDFMRTAFEDHVIYTETRFNPGCSRENGLRYETIFEALIRGMERGKKEFGIEYGIIACCMRHYDQATNLQMMKAAREFLGNGVVAADLAGGEAVFPMHQFMDLFAEIKKMGLPFTLHAGECGNAQNIIDSIEAGAKRIGHGIAMQNRPDIQELCKSKHIGIEMCPISNIQTKAIDDVRNYPIQDFLEKELLVTINTDNRTVSNTSLLKEIQFVQENYHITDGQIKNMMLCANEISFATDDIKHRVWKQLQV